MFSMEQKLSFLGSEDYNISWILLHCIHPFQRTRSRSDYNQFQESFENPLVMKVLLGETALLSHDKNRLQEMFWEIYWSLQLNL